MERYLEFKTKNNNNYVFDSKSCLVLTKDRLEDEQFIHHIDRLCETNRNIYKKELIAEDVRHYILRNGLKELLLECTTSCNLRCKYCIFSGNYIDQRDHGTAFLNEDTAILAIEKYLVMCSEAKKFNPNLRPMIGFYGGEPLLNMEIIKTSIEYIKSFTEFEDIFLSLTTNGTLLNKEAVDYLTANNVHVILSLDGSKEEHNRNRVNVKGEGTFDTIMKNLEYYFTKRSFIFTNSVYDLRTNLLEVAKFFQDNPKLINIGVSPVKSEGTDYYSKFTREEKKIFEKRLEIMKDIFYNDFVDDSSGVLSLK